MIVANRAFQTFRSAFEKVDSGIKLHHYGVRNFRGNIHFTIERGDFVIQTATSGLELEECLRLRFEVFHKEYRKKRRLTGVDVDWFDLNCDHLMIKDLRTNQTIGTYRLNCSLFSDRFYSQSEFDLGKIISLPGTKLELGRACIAKSHRTGAVISLLWRGIAEYIRLTKSDYVFGCSSVKTIDPMEIGRITRRLKADGCAVNDLNVMPLKKYRLKQLPLVLAYLDSIGEDPAAIEIPALFQSYLKMNAKICGEPAIDRDFYCTDYLTLIRVSEIHPAIRARFKLAPFAVDDTAYELS